MDTQRFPAGRRLSQMIRMTAPCKALHKEEAVEVIIERIGFCTDSAKPENSEDVPYPLTKEEALTFVETRLKIPEPEALCARDRLRFLNIIAMQLDEKFPFNNIPYFRKTPLWEIDENVQKDSMLACEGGPCWYVNPFTKALLEHFRFRAYHICGCAPGTIVYDNHITTVVQDVAYPGSLHLVDPGTRRPMTSAIPLNFEKESPEYQFHFMRCKFFRVGEDLIWCVLAASMKSSDDYTISDSSGRVWQQMLIYHLNEKRNWYQYVQIFKELERIVGNSQPPFNGLLFFGYLHDECILSVTAYKKNIFTYLYERDGTLKKSKTTKPALLRLFQENYPQYSDNTLRELFEICPFD